jgi:hypothetical protein
LTVINDTLKERTNRSMRTGHKVCFTFYFAALLISSENRRWIDWKESQAVGLKIHLLLSNTSYFMFNILL